MTTTLSARASTLERQLADRRAERADLLERLNSNPGDAKIDAMAAAVEAEITTLEASLDRLAGACEEAATRSTAADHRSHVEALEADQAEVARLADEMLDTASQFYQHLQACMPMLQRLADLGAKRADIAAAVVAAGAASHSQRTAVRVQAAMQLGPLSALVEAALRDAGIGRIGPSTGVTVPQAPAFPGLDGWGGPIGQRRRVGPDRSQDWRQPGADAVALAAAWHSKEKGATTAALAKAIAVARERPTPGMPHVAHAAQVTQVAPAVAKAQECESELA